MKINFEPIGVIHSPYIDEAPRQVLEDSDSEIKIEVFDKFTDGLYRLDKCRYIYVIYFLHRDDGDLKLRVISPWGNNLEVGVFASRSPKHPNPIGISIVRVLKIEDNLIYINNIDTFDGTPVLDIKPYFARLDLKLDANNGWIEEEQA